ncbi:MAG TPA: FHA domain-containing protein [Conexibacter sp.]|nr:FHA domain-containing protein [Conexibacter sp.]
MTPRTAANDLRTAALQRTEALEAVDRALAEAGAPHTPPLPGRYLLVAHGHEQRRVPLTRSITHLGRGFAATLQLEDPGVSRRHAIIVQRRGGARILDDRSANGTWVNGRRVFDVELCDGDMIVLGRAVLVYVDASA